MRKILVILWAMAFAVGMARIASAALIDAPVPDNAYITIDGYDVAWINPVSDDDYLDMSYQSAFGWQVMTLDVFNMLEIDAFDFVVEGGNVDYFTGNNYDEVSGAYLYIGGITDPLPQGDLAIAVPYFSTVYHYGDWPQAVNGDWEPIKPDWFYSETLAYRPHSVPEPATMLLLGSGLIGLAGFRRKFKKG